MVGKSMSELKSLLRFRRKDRGSVTQIATRLGIARNHELIVPEWLAPTDKDKIPKSERIAFPKPPKAAGILVITTFKYFIISMNSNLSTNAINFSDGSLLYERIPNKPDVDKATPNNITATLKRKPYDEVNGIDGKLIFLFKTPSKSLP
jgi:metastasis-associated protein MTA